MKHLKAQTRKPALASAEKGDVARCTDLKDFLGKCEETFF
jgi:hypothetical protein